jgi:hypothetical protein
VFGVSRMSEEKVVDRNVPIALVITCVILAAGLIGVTKAEDDQTTSLQKIDRSIPLRIS